MERYFWVTISLVQRWGWKKFPNASSWQWQDALEGEAGAIAFVFTTSREEEEEKKEEEEEEGELVEHYTWIDAWHTHEPTKADKEA